MDDAFDVRRCHHFRRGRKFVLDFSFQAMMVMMTVLYSMSTVLSDQRAAI